MAAIDDIIIIIPTKWQPHTEKLKKKDHKTLNEIREKILRISPEIEAYQGHIWFSLFGINNAEDSKPKPKVNEMNK